MADNNQNNEEELADEEKQKALDAKEPKPFDQFQQDNEKIQARKKAFESIRNAFGSK